MSKRLELAKQNILSGLNKNCHSGLSKKGSPSVLAVGGGHCPVCPMEKLTSRRPSTMKMSGLLYLTQPQNFKGHKSQFESTKLMASQRQ